MAAVTQADFLKAMQDVQGKITAVQQTASVQQIANEASREALKKDIKQMTEGVVDAATAKFTLLEQQARNQQELTQGVIQAAKTEFDEVKRVIDNTTEGILASVADLAQRVKQLEDHVGGPQVQDQARVLEMMKGFSSRMDAMENSSGGLQQGGGQSRRYLLEKSTIRRAKNGIWMNGGHGETTLQISLTRRMLGWHNCLQTLQKKKIQWTAQPWPSGLECWERR